MKERERKKRKPFPFVINRSTKLFNVFCLFLLSIHSHTQKNTQNVYNFFWVDFLRARTLEQEDLNSGWISQLKMLFFFFFWIVCRC